MGNFYSLTFKFKTPTSLQISFYMTKLVKKNIFNTD